MGEDEKNSDFTPSNNFRPRNLMASFSPHFQQYINFFEGIAPNQNCHQRLRAKGVEHHPDREQKETIIIKEIKASSNYEAVLMEVYFGSFVLTISLLNRYQPSLTHSCERIGKGAAGDIYECSFRREEPQVIKCVGCPDYSSRKSPLVAVLQQYCFLKICSILEAGPRIGSLFGFDIVCYPNCIEFAMERCQLSKAMTVSCELSLKQSLLQLHSLHIIHFDIKPANIGFSTDLQKPVFLDFGFSRIINESPGVLKELLFSGTVGYCSQEMGQAYFSKDQRMIDPYFNDVVGLQRSLQYLYKERETGSHGNDFDPENYFNKNFPSESISEGRNGNEQSKKEETRERDIAHKELQLMREKQLLLMQLLHDLFIMEPHSFESSHDLISSQLPFHHRKITSFLLHIYPNPALKQLYRTYIERHPQYDSKQLYTHFHKYPITEDSIEHGCDFRHRIAAVFDYEISFLANGATRARAEPSQVLGRLLKGRGEFVTAQEYHFHLIEFIAFNHLERHHSLADKMRVCDAFLQEDMGVTFGTVEAVHKTISRLISLALVPPLTLFSRFLFTMSFEQSCILNLLKDRDIINLIGQILFSKLTPYNKLVLFVEFDRCLLWFKVRLVFHNFVCWRSVKKVLTIAVSQMLGKRGKLLTLQTYFHYNFLNNIDYESFATLYERELREVLHVESNETERKSLRLNLICKTLFLSEGSTTKATYSNFKAFERLFFERNREFFSSYHIALANCYEFTHNEVQLLRLLEPLRAKLEKQFQYLDFQLRLHIKSGLRQNETLQKYANYLIFLADEVKRRGSSLPEMPFQQLLLVKNAMRHQIERAINLVHPLYHEVCQRVTQHSHHYERVILSIFNAKTFPVTYLSDQKIKNFLFDLAMDGKKQCLTRILNSILQGLSVDRSGVDCFYQLYFIRLSKKILSLITIELKIKSQDLQGAQEEYLRMISNALRIMGNPEKQILRFYQDLILLYVQHPLKRRHYGRKFYEAMKSEQFLYLYFRHSKEFIFYVLEGLLTDGPQEQKQRVQQVCQLMQRLSECGYIQCSVRNFVKLLASLRLFMKQQAMKLSTNPATNIASILCTPLTRSPFLAVAVGLLLPCLHAGSLRKVLAKMARAMPFLSENARRAILKPYLSAVIGQLCTGRSRRHKQTCFSKLYNCSELERRLRRAMGEREVCKKQMVIMCRRYYNNFNSMQLEQQK